jgi:hypothetical protein
MLYANCGCRLPSFGMFVGQKRPSNSHHGFNSCYSFVFYDIWGECRGHLFFSIFFNCWSFHYISQLLIAN